MKKVEFANGFYAELSGADAKGQRVIRLYSPDDIALTHCPCAESDFPMMGEALMYGYFAGFADCKRKTRVALRDVMSHVSIVDVQR